MTDKIMGLIYILAFMVVSSIIVSVTGVPMDDVGVSNLFIDEFYENTPKASGEWGQLQDTVYFNSKFALSMLGIAAILSPLIAALKNQ